MEGWRRLRAQPELESIAPLSKDMEKKRMIGYWDIVRAGVLKEEPSYRLCG